VLPLVVGGQLRAVFDLDSPSVARFDNDDAEGMAAALAVLVRGTDWDRASASRPVTGGLP
jgi:GAF domain-containing protein